MAADADPTYNLTALADRLSAEGRLLPLAGKIRRARDLHSLCSDLVIAIETLDALDILMKSSSEDECLTKIAMESALLNNAIILYARATKTTSKERKNYDLRSKFTEEQKMVHKELCDLRDMAVAHFGNGGSYSGEWLAELVILQFDGSSAKPGVVTRRIAISKSLVSRVRGQIEVAQALLRDLRARPQSS